MQPTLSLFRATSRAAYNAKRLQTGLYDGRSILSGNAIGETFENRTRRRWNPNVQSKGVWSEALQEKVKLKVTTGALRTIDKVGGLDSYLCRMRPERLGLRGLELKKLVKEAHARAKAEKRATAPIADKVPHPVQPPLEHAELL